MRNASNGRPALSTDIVFIIKRGFGYGQYLSTWAVKSGRFYVWFIGAVVSSRTHALRGPWCN